MESVSVWKRFIVLTLACTLLLLGGCGGQMRTAVAPGSPQLLASAAAPESSDAPATAPQSLSAEEAPPPAPRASPGKLGPAATGIAEHPQTPDSVSDAHPDGSAKKIAPLLIYEATLALAVYEVGASLDRVEEMAKAAGGYLVQRNSTSIVVRVPAGNFDSSLRALLGLGDVLQRDVRVEDVTAKVLDMQARLKNAEAVRVRFTELLSNAKKVEEALAVERELARVTEDIERMKGQLKLWSELIAFSTISVRFSAPQAENLDRRFRLPFPWLDNLGLSNLLRL